MTMPSANAVLPDPNPNPNPKFPAASDLPPPLWFPDHRDAFISWLRGEFAAANAIIDTLTHHLRAVSDPGDYDSVINAIQQRRCNWTSVLHMQQYFPVNEIGYALNDVAWRKQHHHPHHRYFDHPKSAGKEFRRSNAGFNRNHGARGADPLHREVPDSGVEGCMDNAYEVTGSDQNSKISVKKQDPPAEDENENALAKNLSDISLKSSGAQGQVTSGNSKSESGLMNGGCMLTSKEGDDDQQSENRKQGSSPVPKTFLANELFDGKMVNVVDGMKLYENLLDDGEVKRLVSLVNDLRAAGKKGQFQGQTYFMSKRPIKGRGREIIQLGMPIIDVTPEDEKERKIEAIPALLQDVIERIFHMNLMTVKPDSCIIDFFNEGDHSQPYSWPYWFDRPICLLSLTECDMTFGRVIAVESTGNFKGSLKLSMAPGSLLAMQGKSADMAKYALPSLRKMRILITFTKSEPKKFIPIDIQPQFPLPVQNHHRSPTPNKPLNHVRHPAGSKYYGPVRPKNVMPASSIVPALNGMQPLLVASPSMTFPTPVPIAAPSNPGWPAAPPRHPAPPHLNVPGTGVFLPPGSGVPASPDQVPPSANSNHNPNVEERGLDKENGQDNTSQCNADCNGIVDGAKVMDRERT